MKWKRFLVHDNLKILNVVDKTVFHQKIDLYWFILCTLTGITKDSSSWHAQCMLSKAHLKLLCYYDAEICAKC